MNAILARLPMLCLSILTAVLAVYGFHFSPSPVVYVAFVSFLMLATISLKMSAIAPLARIKLQPRYKFDRAHFRRVNDPLLI